MPIGRTTSTVNGFGLTGLVSVKTVDHFDKLANLLFGAIAFPVATDPSFSLASHDDDDD